jgi:hypothetical protein
VCSIQLETDAYMLSSKRESEETYFGMGIRGSIIVVEGESRDRNLIARSADSGATPLTPPPGSIILIGIRPHLSHSYAHR